MGFCVELVWAHIKVRLGFPWTPFTDITWINLNSSMTSNYKVLHEITSIPNNQLFSIDYLQPFNRATVEVWEWISNFILHFTGQVNTYPCWD